MNSSRKIDSNESITIVVSPGTYTSITETDGTSIISVDQNDIFDLESLSFVSSDGPEVTFIDGQNSKTGFNITGFGVETTPITISGFTIENCYGNGILLKNTANILIFNCILDANQASSAILIDGGPVTEEAPVIDNCIFTNNTHSAIHTWVSGPSISNCIFNNNIGWPAVGLGYRDNSTILNCTFSENQAELAGAIEGGCCYEEDGLNSKIINSSFVDNIGTDLAGAILTGSQMEITGCEFIGNSAPLGGAICIGGDTNYLLLKESIFLNNQTVGTTNSNDIYILEVIPELVFEGNCDIPIVDIHDNSEGSGVRSLYLRPNTSIQGDEFRLTSTNGSVIKSNIFDIDDYQTYLPLSISGHLDLSESLTVKNSSESFSTLSIGDQVPLIQAGEFGEQEYENYIFPPLNDDLALVANNDGTSVYLEVIAAESVDFTSPESVTLECEPLAVEPFDLDQDGDNEFVVLTQCEGNCDLHFLNYNPYARSGDQIIELIPSKTLSETSNDLTIGDANGDGVDDIVVLDSRGAMEVFELNGYLQLKRSRIEIPLVSEDSKLTAVSVLPGILGGIILGVDNPHQEDEDGNVIATDGFGFMPLDCLNCGINSFVTTPLIDINPDPEIDELISDPPSDILSISGLNSPSSTALSFGVTAHGQVFSGYNPYTRSSQESGLVIEPLFITSRPRSPGKIASGNLFDTLGEGSSIDEIIISSPDEGEVLLFNADESNNFQAPSIFSVDKGVFDLQIVDADGDGDSDIVYTNPLGVAGYNPFDRNDNGSLLLPSCQLLRNDSDLQIGLGRIFNTQVIPTNVQAKFLLVDPLEEEMVFLPFGAYNLFDRGEDGLASTQIELISILDEISVSCLGDSNNDSIVDVLDLLEVIGSFGTSGPNGDVNDDSSVDVLDLLEVIGNFGQSC